VTDFTPDTLPTPRRFFLHDDFADVADRLQVLPDTGIDNPEVALRVYRRVGSFDAAAYAYRGYWRSPGQEPDDYDVPTQVTHFFPRLSVYGVSAQGQAMGGVLSLEGGYYDSRDDNAGVNAAISNSEVRFLLGYQKQLSDDFTLGAQYYAEAMMDFDDYKRALPDTSTAKKKYHDIVTLRLTRLLKHQTWMLSLFVFYSPEEKDYLLQPQVDYRVSDKFSTTLGANLFGGEKQTTFFGQFDRNDNLYLTLRYDF
jgi:predicted porin